MNTDFIYREVTDRIASKLEQGVNPWRKTWYCTEDGGITSPCNFVSKRPYNGINTIILAAEGFDSPYWLTFKECSDLGGKVKKGEHSTMIIFWTFVKVQNPDNEEDKEKLVPFLRYYNVFNVRQCEGLNVPECEPVEGTNHIIEKCETIVQGYRNPPAIRFIGSQPCYIPALDVIEIPAITNFVDSENYYDTLFHELGHSTGAAKRLDREGITSPTFGSDRYAFEELIAELTAAFLCGFAGIENKVLDNETAYLKGWAAKLRDNEKWLITAGGKAKHAIDYILNINQETN